LRIFEQYFYQEKQLNSMRRFPEKRRLGTVYAPETTKNAALAEIFAAANWRAAMGEMGFSFRH